MNIVRAFTVFASALSMCVAYAPVSAQEEEDPFAQCYFDCLSNGTRTANFCRTACYKKYPDSGGSGGSYPSIKSPPFDCATGANGYTAGGAPITVCKPK